MTPEHDRRTTLLAAAALLALTACWGSTFFLIKDLLDRVPTLDFLAVRFTIASVALLVVAPQALGRLSPVVRRHAVVLGLLYGVAQILQTAGLAHTAGQRQRLRHRACTSCSRPLLAAAILRTRIPPITWVAVALATVGLGVLALQRLQRRLRRADHAVVGRALRPAHRRARGLVDGPGRGRHDDPADHGDRRRLHAGHRARRDRAADRTGDWVSVAYMAVVVGALGLLGQTWAQAHLPPTRSAIIMSMEPVFASVFAVSLGGEDVTDAAAARRRDGARRHADRRARAPPRGRGRGPAHRRLSRPSHPETEDERGPSAYRGPVDTCVRCGAELGVGRFCLNCGHPIGEPAPAAALVEDRPATTASTAPAAPHVAEPSRAGHAVPSRRPTRPLSLRPALPVTAAVVAPEPAPVRGRAAPKAAAQPAGAARVRRGTRRGPAPLRGGRRARADAPVRGPAWIVWVLGAVIAGRPGLRAARDVRHGRGRHRDRRADDERVLRACGRRCDASRP